MASLIISSIQISVCYLLKTTGTLNVTVCLGNFVLLSPGLVVWNKCLNTHRSGSLVPSQPPSNVPLHPRINSFIKKQNTKQPSELNRTVQDKAKHAKSSRDIVERGMVIDTSQVSPNRDQNYLFKYVFLEFLLLIGPN